MLDFVNISDINLFLHDMWDNGQWCLDKLATILPVEVQACFNSIAPLRQFNGQVNDSWVWKGAKDGVYNVSSGYDWLLADSSTWDNSVSWNWVWKTKVPAKVQFLIWLIIQKALPTNSIRFRCRFADNPSCQRCSVIEESLLHYLRDCPHLKEVWLRLGMGSHPPFFHYSDVLSWVKE